MPGQASERGPSVRRVVFGGRPESRPRHSQVARTARYRYCTDMALEGVGSPTATPPDAYTRQRVACCSIRAVTGYVLV